MPATSVVASDLELFTAFSVYQEARSYSEATIRRRRLTLTRFARFMTPASVLTATAEDVDDFLAKLVTARTRHAYRSDVNTFFRWALRRGLATANPVDATDGVRIPRSLPRPAPVEAIARAFAMADGDTQLMVMLGALAGLRRAEIAGLSAGDVHLEAEPPVLIVRDGKGGKDRVVPLHPTLIGMLRGWMEQLTRSTGQHTSWLFRSPRGKGPLSPDAVARRCAKALSTPDQRVSTHQLRHYFGTEAARWSGGNVVLVGSLMGHASTQTTMGYIGWSPTEGAEVVAKIVTAGVDDEVARRRAMRG